MSEKQTKTIKPNTKCKIVKESDYFLNKYGTSTPNIVIEDLTEVVFDDKEWWNNYNNPAIASFLLRSVMQGFNPEEIGGNIYYGKIYTKDTAFGLGEIVWESELEENEGQ